MQPKNRGVIMAPTVMVVMWAAVMAVILGCCVGGARADLHETIDYSAAMFCVSRIFDIDYDTFISKFDADVIFRDSKYTTELFWAGLSAKALISQCDDDGDGRISFTELNSNPPCLRVPQVQGIVQFICNPYFGTDYEYDQYQLISVTAFKIYNTYGWSTKADLYSSQLRHVRTYRHEPRGYQVQGVPFPQFDYHFKGTEGTQRAAIMFIFLIIGIITFPCLLLCGCFFAFPALLTLGAATV